MATRAMEPDAKLLVAERIFPPGNGPSVAGFLDFEMLFITGGRERTEVEFEELLKSSGFELAWMIPAKESVCVLEGIRL